MNVIREISEGLLDRLKDDRLRPVLLKVLIVYVVLCLLFGLMWSREPVPFDVIKSAEHRAQEDGHQIGPGYVTVNALREVAKSLWNKQRNYFLGGGYISNDIMPPGLYLDNIQNWEFGVLVQVRDLARVLRKDLSRSQSQSAEDPNLARAEPQLNYDNDSWWLPTTEQEFKKGERQLKKYLDRLAGGKVPSAQFFARADNLRNWLADVETRLGSQSQRLSASVGRRVINTDFAGDSASQPAHVLDEVDVQTPWFEIDDVFYETRGTCWALIHFFRAIEVDFYKVLEKKNALVSVQQIIRELEATQETLWSPFILNGGGFTMLPNHSLVMANYVSRANAAIIDLRELLAKG